MLCVAFAVLGFAGVAFVTALMFVPAGSGLAGPAIVVGYGGLGGLVAAGIAVILGFRLAPKALMSVAIVSSALALLCIAGLTVRAVMLHADDVRPQTPETPPVTAPVE